MLSTDAREFVFRWMVANMVGLALGLALWGIIHDTLGEESANPNILASLVGELLVGAIAGTLQWFVLKPYLNGVYRGILGGSIGCAIGLIFGYFLGGIPFDFILGFIGFGLGSSWGHLLGLSHLMPGTRRWIVTNTVGFGIAGIVAVIVAILLGDGVDAAFGSGVSGFAAVLAMLGGVGGAVGGLITGMLLVNMLRQPAPQAEMAASTT